MLLLPVFWASYFNQYEGSMFILKTKIVCLRIGSLTWVDFETYYFGVRARALIGFVGELFHSRKLEIDCLTGHHFARLSRNTLLFLDYQSDP